jgi:hypothetical protein
MSEENKTVETKVTTENINIEDVFPMGPDADSVTLPEEAKPNIMDPINPKPDMSFTEPVEKEDWMDEEDVVAPEEVTKKTEEGVKAEGAEILSDIANDTDDDSEGVDEDRVETRGRKPINGVQDVFDKLIKDEKFFAFEDDKPISEYSPKDLQDLIEANLEERANQVRRETPKQFFEALPNELKVAAQYVADGGTDLKSLFKTLAQAEETFDLDSSTESGQENIIMQYLSTTGYGTQEEINEEIEIWKDLGKLEQQAMKFKPKLDKMQEKVVAQKLQEQQLKQKQQEQASKQYMHNVYETLKEGKVNDLKIDKRTQSLLYNGLVQPAYPSVNGKNTNLLGHLLEKYQFQEPNYGLITEALWLLADPDGYKSKIMEKGAQKSVEKTVRKLKTEQANRNANSMGVQQTAEDSKKTKPNRKKISRPNNFFKRM